MICPLCDRTVTRYRKGTAGVTRQVWEDCFFSLRKSRREQGTDSYEENDFLLIIPGEADIAPGDRIVPGTAPEQTVWEDLIPSRIPDLCQVEYVRQFAPDHTEAGRGRYVYA